MSEHMNSDMEQGSMMSEAEFDAMRNKVDGLSPEQKQILLAQLHDPNAGEDERYLSNNHPEA